MMNLKSFCSSYRAVAAVRLLRIERGGAFADLLNAKGKGLRKNEMDYVERTLGFRTRELDNVDIRLILRIGFFDILKLNIPSYAVVNEEKEDKCIRMYKATSMQILPCILLLSFIVNSLWVGEAKWRYLYLVLAELILTKMRGDSCLFFGEEFTVQPMHGLVPLDFISEKGILAWSLR